MIVEAVSYLDAQHSTLDREMHSDARPGGRAW